MELISEVAACEVMCRCCLNIFIANFCNEDVYFENASKEIETASHEYQATG